MAWPRSEVLKHIKRCGERVVSAVEDSGALHSSLHCLAVRIPDLSSSEVTLRCKDKLQYCTGEVLLLDSLYSE
jgi:hypothetical protein